MTKNSIENSQPFPSWAWFPWTVLYMHTPTMRFRVRVTKLGLLDAKLWPPQGCGSGHGQEQATERRVQFRDTSKDKFVDVALDLAVAQLITDNLELEMEPIRYGFDRYAKHGFRAKSRGLGGSLLGDTGEVLTYALYNIGKVLRSIGDKEKLIRVVGYISSDAEGPFPMPDFIISDGTAGIRALEVKSREAFDVLDLQRQDPRHAIGACDAIEGAREEALPQLGFPPKVKGSKKFLPANPKPKVPPCAFAIPHTRL